MSINRQQRRKLAKQKEVEAKYYRQLQARQEVLNDGELELNMVCLALALYELYKWDYDQIMEAIREFNRQLIRIYYGETYDDLKADLKKKTEIEFLITRKGGEEFWAAKNN